MEDIKNTHISGDVTITSNSNIDNGMGVLFTNFIGEASTDLGVSITDSNLYINNSGGSAVLKLINDVSEETIFELNSSTNNVNGDFKSFRLLNNSGDTLLQSKGNKGIKINKDTGNILIDSLADAINSSTASIVSQGGLSIGKSVLVQKEISALDGIHILTNTASTENVLNITNTSSSGYSSINFKNSALSVKLDIGYGNGLVGNPLNDMAYIQSKNGSELLFRGNSTDSFKISTDASLDFYSSIASTSNATGSIRLLGGIGVSNTTDATSITNGGSFTTGGGMAIAKKLYVGGNTRIEGDLTVVGAINGGGGGGTSDHGALTGLLDDDHSQYMLLTGRPGGQILTGGISSNDNLIIRSTSNITKGSIIIDEATPSSSSSTGAVLISGGVAISNTTDATSITSGGSITTAGGVAVAKKLYVGDSTATSSSSTGAVIISGGVAISNTTDATSITSGGSITTAGGVAVAKKLYVGGDTSLNSHLDVTNINTPSNPSSGISRIYVDSSDNLLKSKNSSGVVKIYNPLSTKGDILSHNGITDVRIPAGVNNQILYADSSLSSGVGWKNISTESNTNPSKSKYLEAYNTTSQTITGVYEPVVVDASRLIDLDFFTKINDRTVKVLVTGVYTIFGRVTTATVSGNSSANQCSVVLQIDDTFDSYSIVPGTKCYTTNKDNGDGTSTAAFSCVLPISEHQKIQIRCKQDIGTNVIATLNNGCNLLILRPGVDDSDNSKFFNGYVNTNTNLTGVLSDINININRVMDSSYTHTVNTAGISFNDTAKYTIFCSVGFYKTSGVGMSCTESILLLSDINGNNFTVVNASAMYGFHNSVGSFSSASSQLILNISPGQILKLQSRILSGTNIRVESDSTQITIINLQSSSSGQSTPKFLDIYNTSSDVINLTYTDLTYNTNRIVDSVYSHTVSTSDIEVSEVGKYIIFAKLSTEHVATSDDSTCRLRILVDNGNGFAELAGSTSTNYNDASVSGKSTLQSIATSILSNGSRLKCQILKISGSGTVSIAANSSEFSMVKIDPEDIISEGILIFGSFYKYIESLSSTITTSVSYIQKLQMTTDYIVDGYYRIGIFYSLSNSSNNGQMGARVQVDDITTIQEDSFSIQANNTNNPIIFYTPIQIQLLAGIHSIDLDFRNITGITTISNVKMEMWRVV